MEKIAKFLSRLNKQIESSYMVVSVSTDPDELATIHIGTNGEIYLDEVLLPYSISDVVRICHKNDEEYEDDSYIKMFFNNGDWLSISALLDYTAKIKGTMYYDSDVVSIYHSITNKKIEQHFSTPQEVFDKMNQCAEKADVWIDVSTEEDEDSEIWFDDNGVLWIDNTIRTPYSLKDIDSVTYCNDDVMPEHYVRISFKTDGGRDNIDVYGYSSYKICVSRGKMTRIGVYDDNEEINHIYQNIIEAKELGIYNDEYVVLNGVLIRYNGNSTEISIPEGVQIIEEGTFCQAPITSVKCPSTLIWIRKYCFAWCDELQDVKLNEGLKAIEKSAFSGCKKLTNIDLPTTLKSITEGAFDRTPVAEKFSDEYVVNDNVLVRYIGKDTELIIPEGIEIIDESVFSESLITRVVCPSTLKHIKEYAFFRCKELRDVLLNDGLLTIEHRAFYGCENIKQIKIPKTVNSIGNQAFKQTPVEQYIIDFKNAGEYNRQYFSEIFKLKEFLEDANIPFAWDSVSEILGVDGYRIILFLPCEQISAVEHKGSYGGSDNKIEIWGALTAEENTIDSVFGGLTAEEVFKRFKYCYENNTPIYIDNE